MRCSIRCFLTLLALVSVASSASAGPITSTIGGASSVTVLAGALVTVDSVITFGPTAVSGFGSGFEVSFTATSVVSGGGSGPMGGATVTPPGLIDLTGGTFTCNGDGFCDNIGAAANFGAPGFPAGATFALASVTIDTSGLAGGEYAVGALLGPIGPDGIVISGVDFSSEYFAVNAFITIPGPGIPEPGTGALLGLGLGILGLARRRRRPSRMRLAKLSILAPLGVLLATSASAGPITSTIGGASNVTVFSGTLVTVDNVVTFGPTTVGGFGSAFEISFDGTSVVAGGGAGPSGGATVFPADWIDLTGGAFTCNASGFCDNIAAAANFGVPGFAAGATFALASVVVDTTGLVPGVYAVGALLSAVGPDGVFTTPGVDVSGEYFAVNSTITVVVPEPGSAVLLSLGLGLLGFARRR